MMREAERRLIMMDPNIRQGFINDEAKYRARIARMMAASDIVKVSDEDLDWIIPGPERHAEKIPLLLQAGPAVVIVTKGGDGATGYLADGTEVTVPVRKVEVVDTVGAGDTFNAGVLAQLARAGQVRKEAVRALTTDNLRAALELGAQVAAITVSRAGANPPWAHEV